MKPMIAFLLFLLYVSGVVKAATSLVEEDLVKNHRPAFRFEASGRRFPYWRSFPDEFDFSGPETELQGKAFPGSDGYNAPSRKRGAYFDMPWG
ncbi:unnamed protein product [Dibothriocephalus latus]|uniref:Uncharacterized protein n=1 Tax=Dibothriocephalus latus TaxID=60516 RepID=A0A3P7N262_DIBLA|nr:unnamed protein product [Dibothriocephalus latus]